MKRILLTTLSLASVSQATVGPSWAKPLGRSFSGTVVAVVPGGVKLRLAEGQNVVVPRTMHFTQAGRERWFGSLQSGSLVSVEAAKTPVETVVSREARPVAVGSTPNASYLGYYLPSTEVVYVPITSAEAYLDNNYNNPYSYVYQNSSHGGGSRGTSFSSSSNPRVASFSAPTVASSPPGGRPSAAAVGAPSPSLTRSVLQLADQAASGVFNSPLPSLTTSPLTAPVTNAVSSLTRVPASVVNTASSLNSAATSLTRTATSLTAPLLAPVQSTVNSLTVSVPPVVNTATGLVNSATSLSTGLLRR